MTKGDLNIITIAMQSGLWVSDQSQMNDIPIEKDAS